VDLPVLSAAIFVQRNMVVHGQKKQTKSLPKVAKTKVKKDSGASQVKKIQRAPWVTQPSKMTSEKWKKLQVGMAEKWPQPDYMVVVDPGRSHTNYRDETYTIVSRWTADTKIEFRPHAKAPGSKSHNRYEAYAKARTIGEALKFGTYPADWCWDYERGFIKVVGGFVREEPLDPSDDGDQKNVLTDVDVVVTKWFKREAARMLGFTLKEMGEQKSWCEDILMRLRRSVAERKAKVILEECERLNRKVNDADVYTVLDSWAFRRNVTRINVLPDGATFVYSDTVGLIPARDGRIMTTPPTIDFPCSVKVLARYLKDNLPADVPFFPFTSININKNYAGRLHRDSNNVGPSCIKAFGDFTGGALNYFPNDDKQTHLDDLDLKESVSIDLKNNLTLFDGRRGHWVSPFEGNRYSLVWFTCARCVKAEDAVKCQLKEREMNFPNEKQIHSVLGKLAPPLGAGADKKKVAAGGPQFKAWPISAAPKDVKRKLGLFSKPCGKKARNGGS